MLEAVINVSEGRREAVVAALRDAAEPSVLDVHRDPHHHRAVFTLGGPAAHVELAARRLAEAALARLDLRRHTGAHPRLGVVDVVPFVPLGSGPQLEPGLDLAPAVTARDRFAAWAAHLGLPCFLYGPLPAGERTLPEVRRRAFVDLVPDAGPARPHPSAGALAVGARPPLVAFNLFVAGTSRNTLAAVAARLRRPEVRTLALALGDRLQLSCNLVDPFAFGPAALADAAAGLLEPLGAQVTGAELVGLLPRLVLEAVPEERWEELDLSPGATVEARLGWS